MGTAVQSDGKVVGVGETGASGGGATLLVVRFTGSGSLDSSFGSGGQVKGPAIPTPSGNSSVGRAVAVQSDGKIVVVGKATDSSGNYPYGLVVERYNANGSRDTSFGTGGVVDLLTGSNPAFTGGDGYAVKIQPDGKIVVTGSVTAAGSNGTAPRVAVARLNTNGSLDTSFGAGGIDVLDLGAYSYALAVALQSDGKIVIAGSQAPGLQVPNALIARLTPSGALDTSFAGSGAYAHQYAQGAASSAFNAVAVQSDGKIVAAGAAASGNSGADAFVARFTSGGAPDGSFGSGGVVYTPSAVNWSSGATPALPGANGEVIAVNGDVVVAGTYANSIQTFATVWAFTKSGALDTTFGHNGAAVLTNSDRNNTEFAALAVSPINGYLVAAGDGSPFTAPPIGIAVRYVGFGSPPPPPPPPPPAFKLTLRGLNHSYKTASVVKHRLKLKVACNQACTVRVSLTISKAIARKLHLPGTIASAKVTLGKSGTRVVTLRLAANRGKALERQRSVSLTLVVSGTAKARAAHRSHTIRRGLRFTR